MIKLGIPVQVKHLAVLLALLVSLNKAFINLALAEEAKKAVPTSSVFVSPNAKDIALSKVAVLPFQVPAGVAGERIADAFSREVLKTYKYHLVERSQVEQALGEKLSGIQGDISGSDLIQIGRLLGVDGVILGTVPEYGLRAVEENQIPSMEMDIRMINVSDGTVVWSISDSAIGSAADQISVLETQLIQRAVQQLRQEWIKAGDTLAVNLPTISPKRVEGGVREANITFSKTSPDVFSAYRIYRSRTESGTFDYLDTANNTSSRRAIVYSDTNLMDGEAYYYKVLGVAPSGLNGPPSQTYEALTVGAPSAVLGFSAEGNLANRIPLSWNSSSEPYVKGYNIYRATEANGPFRRITQVVGSTKNTYLDKGSEKFPSLENFTDYYYRINAVNVVNVESIPSPVIRARTKPVPTQVSGFLAQSNLVKRVELQWQANPEADIQKYLIYTGKKADNVNRKLREMSAGETSFTHKRLRHGANYYYRVVAIDFDNLESESTDIVHARTKPRPLTPTGFTVDLLGDSILLTWNSNNELDIRNYEIKTSGRFLLEKAGRSIETTQTRYTFDGLKPGGVGKFNVRAIDRAGLVSDYTEVIQVTIPKPDEFSNN